MAGVTKNKTSKKRIGVAAKAQLAVKAAYQRALRSGAPVVISEHGVIYRIVPGGTREIVKRLAPPTPVKKGMKLTIA